MQGSLCSPPRCPFPLPDFDDALGPWPRSHSRLQRLLLMTLSNENSEVLAKAGAAMLWGATVDTWSPWVLKDRGGELWGILGSLQESNTVSSWGGRQLPPSWHAAQHWLQCPWLSPSQAGPSVQAGALLRSCLPPTETVSSTQHHAHFFFSFFFGMP